jgi:hypothetical protein
MFLCDCFIAIKNVKIDNGISQNSAKRSGSKMMLACDYRIATFENQNLITVIAKSAKRSGKKKYFRAIDCIIANKKRKI